MLCDNFCSRAWPHDQKSGSWWFQTGWASHRIASGREHDMHHTHGRSRLATQVVHLQSVLP